MTINESYLGSPENPRTSGIVCYITIIGWLIAYFGLYKNNRNPFAAFHIRQSLFLHILSVILYVLTIVSFLGQLPHIFVVLYGLFVVILWLIAAYGAINGDEKPAPIIGNIAQNLFSNL